MQYTHPSKMSPFFLGTVFFLLISMTQRDSEFVLCGSESSEEDPCLSISPNNLLFSKIFSAKLPTLAVCFNRKLLPLPSSRPSFKLPILLLLAGDVSLNPGPSCTSSGLKIATMNVRSIRQNTASF